jgi:hypothetical protein
MSGHEAFGLVLGGGGSDLSGDGLADRARGAAGWDASHRVGMIAGLLLGGQAALR